MTSAQDSTGEPWGHRLRRWRSETTNWSQEEFVDQVVRLAYAGNEGRGTSLDVRLVGRWESGQVKRPQGIYRRLLGQLGAPAPDAPACSRTQTEPRLPGSCPVDAPQPFVASPIEDDFDFGNGDPSVQRRDLLRAGSTLAISGLLAAVVGGSTAGSATPDVVEELAQRLTSLRKLDDTLGGADTYRLYAAEAELTAHLLRDGTHHDSVQRRLLALHAEQSQQAGWAAFDAGWHDMARDHYRRSHAAATESGDTGLAGNALTFHAYQRSRGGTGRGSSPPRDRRSGPVGRLPSGRGASSSPGPRRRTRAPAGRHYGACRCCLALGPYRPLDAPPCREGYRGSRHIPWHAQRSGAATRRKSAGDRGEPGVGIEPTTYRLQGGCSTTELHRRTRTS